MKSLKWLIFSFVVCIAIQPILGTSQAMALSNRIQVKDEWIGASQSNKQNQSLHLTDNLITLYGGEDSTELTYQMRTGSKVEQSTLTLNIEASPLLIAPSSLTILIDGELQQTVALSGKKQKKSIQIKLTKAQMKAGYHRVQLVFYGVLKEGICINQETPGTWLKIYPESEIKLKGSKIEDVSLESFPYPFVQTGDSQEQTDIVLPNKPDENEIEAAIKLYRTLKNTNRETVIHFKQEKEVKKISHPTIAIGAENSWNGQVKAMFKQADLKVEKQKLSLAIKTFVANKKEQSMLFVTADQPSTLVKKIGVLIHNEMTDQLTGSDIQIDRMPSADSKVSSHISLTDFGGDDVTVGTKKTTSDHFFYPKALMANHKAGATFNLKLKRSDASNKEERLTVMINHEPHAVPLTKLGKQDEDGFYHVTIPVDSNVLQKNEYVDLQFVTSGFKKLESCKNTDEEGWIFIDKSSSLILPQDNQSDTLDLAAWPLPYASSNEQEKTSIVIPNEVNQQTFEQLAMLSESFSQPKTSDYRIVKASSITNQQLQNHSLIFLGGVQAFPFLKEKETELIVPSTNGGYDVSSFGMINETTARIVWTQPSLWNDEHAMTIFTGMNGSDQAISKEVIEFLQTNTNTATVAIESKNKEMFSNHQTVSNVSKGQQTEEKQSNNQPWMYFTLMAVLILLVLAIILYIVKRSRKKLDS
ncbi:cellulose biosynthesis cyclic di-GMP-binding regulatory protein BcsB [Bacillus sp. NPDC077027]|uniref:cellulose biosynthesis cyclic di-GMP-binding regulatory protein BcsB n=1 Tax=Bacillus sp. NPDC077027 TaxID=3390548 RepID=UPI003D024EAC